jgi:hypothetical protein
MLATPDYGDGGGCLAIVDVIDHGTRKRNTDYE